MGIRQSRELEQEIPSHLAQRPDSVAVVESRLEAIDLSAGDNDTASCPVDDAPKPDPSDASSSTSIPIHQLATKDEIALIEKGMRSDW